MVLPPLAPLTPPHGGSPIPQSCLRSTGFAIVRGKVETFGFTDGNRRRRKKPKKQNLKFVARMPRIGLGIGRWKTSPAPPGL
jgi:hypothetical protein